MARIVTYATSDRPRSGRKQRPWLVRRWSPRKGAVAQLERRRLSCFLDLPRQIRTGKRRPAHRAMRNVTAS
jgi:hypothetical protein